MSDTTLTDLERTEELFAFLQGSTPDEYRIPDADTPRLTPEQAWTVVLYLGTLRWQVPDHIERCDRCGRLYDTDCEGDYFDGTTPYKVCGGCCDTEEARAAKAAKEKP